MTLQEYCAKNFARDFEYVSSVLASCPTDLHSWVLGTMQKLRDDSTPYENGAFRYLIKCYNNIIFQAPFYICGKVFFADFYVPEESKIIEIDGEYHSNVIQRVKDKERDKLFLSIGITTERIKNNLVEGDRETSKEPIRYTIAKYHKEGLKKKHIDYTYAKKELLRILNNIHDNSCVRYEADMTWLLRVFKDESIKELARSKCIRIVPLFTGKGGKLSNPKARKSILSMKVHYIISVINTMS